MVIGLDRVAEIVSPPLSSLKFCSSHRLPESHLCINLTSCKQKAQQQLNSKLISEKCVAQKI